VTRARLRRSLGLIALGSILSLALTAGTGGVALAAGHSGPTGQRPGGQSRPSSGPVNVTDHGGPVLTSSNVVEIFWGPHSAFDPQLQPAMEDLLGHMSGSAYLGVAQQYVKDGGTISSSLGTSILDQTQPPKQVLSVSDLGAEVAKVLGTTPADPNTIYFVFTSNMPHISYCAYHSDTTVKGITIQVAYVPLQPSFCSIYGKGTNLHANGDDESVQTSADSAAHEFMEAVTDPHLNAWYDKNGAEIADKCEYDYQTYVLLSGSSTHWQIQSNWSNAISACAAGAGH
jgi:hypothetical protein